MASHHVVPKDDSYAAAVQARQILSQANIHLDEAANGVWLPRQKMINDYTSAGKGNWLEGLGPVHEGNNTYAYMDAIRDRLLPVQGQPADVIRDELQRIAKEIVEGTFTW